MMLLAVPAWNCVTESDDRPIGSTVREGDRLQCVDDLRKTRDDRIDAFVWLGGSRRGR